MGAQPGDLIDRAIAQLPGPIAGRISGRFGGAGSEQNDEGNDRFHSNTSLRFFTQVASGATVGSSMTAMHSYSYRPITFIPSPVPFLFAGLAVFALFGALGFLVTHPLLLVLGAWFIAHKASRRHGRHGRSPWRDHHAAKREAFLAACSDLKQQARSPRSARASYQRAVDAVRNSTTVPDERKAELLKQLSAGLAEVAALEEARARLDRFDDVSAKAQAKAAKFEADCDKLTAALAALAIQDNGTEALDQFGAAVDELAGQVDASTEVDDLTV